jgi:hypothetical protein
MYEFTLGEFIDNIEKNGLPQGYHRTFTGYGNIPVENGEACALGQGYWNTIGRPDFIDFSHENDFWNEFNSITGHMHSIDGRSFTSRVIQLNDDQRLPLPEIAEILRIDFVEHLNTPISIGFPEY